MVPDVIRVDPAPVKLVLVISVGPPSQSIGIPVLFLSSVAVLVVDEAGVVALPADVLLACVGGVDDGIDGGQGERITVSVSVLQALPEFSLTLVALHFGRGLEIVI